MIHNIVRNLLIISDLHLGEDIKSANPGYLRHVVKLERELEAFLAHYTVSRIDDRPWRLVINGDMVDFLGICLLPRDGEFAPEDMTPEDHVYGIGSKPKAARAKMLRVLERHPGVFRALGRFVAAGNKLEIVVGNHDVEFHWPVVQETFRQGVSALCAEGEVEAIQANITFHPWFYFEENVAWIEHGHQYDDYCSFDYVLNPVCATDENDIMMNVGAAGLRYVTNQISSGYHADQEKWSMWKYVTWTFAQGREGASRITRGFFHFSSRMLGQWRKFSKTPHAFEARRPRHLERLRQLSAQVKLSEETLTAVDELRRKPAITSLAKVLGVLMLDRLALIAVSMLAMLVFVLSLPWTWAIAAVAGVLTAATLTNRALHKQRADVDPEPKMKLVTETLRKMVRAPFVVFGHTHNPIAQPLSDGGMYYNTGSWFAPDEHFVPISFTHLMIRHEAGGPKAALCQWRDGESREFTPVPPPR